MKDEKISPEKIDKICFNCEVSGICDRLYYFEFLECDIVKRELKMEEKMIARIFNEETECDANEGISPASIVYYGRIVDIPDYTIQAIPSFDFELKDLISALNKTNDEFILITKNVS